MNKYVLTATMKFEYDTEKEALKAEKELNELYKNQSKESWRNGCWMGLSVQGVKKKVVRKKKESK